MQTEITRKHRNPKRYYGKICSSHPDLSGERSISSRSCVGCNLDRMRLRREAGYYKKVESGYYRRKRQKNHRAHLARERFRRTGCDERLFNNLLAFQAGLCPLCHRNMGKHPHADHDHDTKRPRGLLCGNCNRAEGMIRKSGVSPELFAARLTAYLKYPPAEPYLNMKREPWPSLQTQT